MITAFMHKQSKINSVLTIISHMAFIMIFGIHR